MRFLVDEDLPRSLAKDLTASGLRAEDVRDVGLRGKSDVDVFRYAVDQKAVLITADLGFGNPLRFHLKRALGIVIVRIPNEVPNLTLKKSIIHALLSLNEEDFQGSVIVIESGRIRMRKSK